MKLVLWKVTYSRITNTNIVISNLHYTDCSNYWSRVNFGGDFTEHKSTYITDRNDIIL